MPITAEGQLVSRLPLGTSGAVSFEIRSILMLKNPAGISFEDEPDMLPNRQI